MAFLTNNPPFTTGRDVRLSSDGWIVAGDQAIDTLAGNDLIDGKSGRTIDIGIEIVGGTLDLGSGKDTVKGLGRSSSRDTAGIKLLGKSVKLLSMASRSVTPPLMLASMPTKLGELPQVLMALLLGLMLMVERLIQDCQKIKLKVWGQAQMDRVLV